MTELARLYELNPHLRPRASRWRIAAFVALVVALGLFYPRPIRWRF